jgi:CHAT domain-containing protein/Tfp pilus assembly protein PilF
MARMMYSRADALQRSARYDSAIVFFDSARAMYVHAHMSGNQIRCLIGKAVCLQLKGNYDKALEALRMGPEAERTLPQEEPGVAAMRFAALGQIYRQQGKYDTALAEARQAFDILHEYSLREDDLAWEIFSLFAGTYSDRGDLDSALAYNHRALLLFPTPEGEQRTKVSNSYNSIAIIYQARGDYLGALSPYMKALEILRAELGENHPDIAGLYNNIAVIYMRLGDYDLSLEYHLKSLAILTETLESGHPSFGIRYNNIAMVYRSKGEFDKALEFGQKSKAIFVKKLGARHPNVAGVVNNIGRTYADMKEYKRALESYEEALTIWEEKLGQKHPNVTQSYFNIGEAHGKLGDTRNAASWLEKSLRIRRETLGEKNVKVAQSHNALAVVYSGTKDIDTALQCYQKAMIALVESFGNADVYSNPDTLRSPSDLDLLVSLAGKGDLLRRRYEIRHHLPDLKASLDAFKRSAELVEKIRRGFGSEGSKIQLGKTSFDVYEQGIRVAHALSDVTHNDDYISAAFSFAERSKAGVLWDAISESNARRFAGIPDSLLSRESALRGDLAYYETQIQREKDKRNQANILRINSWESAIFDLRRKYEAIIEVFDKSYPEYHSLKLDTKVVSLTDVQRDLDTRAALLEYVVGDSTVSVFVVTKNRCTLESREIHSSLSILVRHFRRSIENLDVSAYLDLGSRLFAELIAPIKTELRGVRKLYVIPDGILNYLPFEALLTKQTSSSSSVDFSVLPYLIRDFDIRYNVSARLLIEHDRKQDRGQINAFVGMAPIFSDRPRHADTAYTAVLRSSKIEKSGEKQVMRSITIDGEHFAELNESENEVRSILRLFDANGLPGKVLLNGLASESEIKSRDTAPYRFIHIATHGIINEEKPKLSGIVFAAPDSGSPDDGVLYSGEIYTLRLNADLVVLSACQSGLGTIAKGEGILGLTRGFMYAGARNLLVSLWQVADKSAAELMVEFYRNILSHNGGSSKSQDYSAALRKAKISMINGKKYAHPVEWSPFVLTGR